MWSGKAEGGKSHTGEGWYFYGLGSSNNWISPYSPTHGAGLIREGVINGLWSKEHFSICLPVAMKHGPLHRVPSQLQLLNERYLYAFCVPGTENSGALID